VLLQNHPEVRNKLRATTSHNNYNVSKKYLIQHQQTLQKIKRNLQSENRKTSQIDEYFITAYNMITKKLLLLE